MVGQYTYKVKGEPQKSKESVVELSSMDEVYNWYSNVAVPNPINLPIEYFIKVSDKEWQLKKAVGDCEMVILRLIDTKVR